MIVHRIAAIAAVAAVLSLALAAGVWLVAASGSAGGVPVPVVPPAAARSGTPPPPPRGALVLARRAGDLAVALAARHAGPVVRLTATIVEPDGTGARGLDVRFVVSGEALPRTAPCGAGCYRTAFHPAAAPRRIAIVLGGTRRKRASVVFALPPHWPVSAAPLLRGAERAIASLRSTVYRERLSSGPRATNTSLWRSEAPDRLSYRTASGDAGIVIGRTRWDLVVGGGWQRGTQNPPLSLPAPAWGSRVYDATLLGRGRSLGRAVVRISFFDPGAFAWYTVTLQRGTLRPLVVDMTAAAHFMQDRYMAFDVAPTIRPPAPGTP